MLGTDDQIARAKQLIKEKTDPEGVAPSTVSVLFVTMLYILCSISTCERQSDI